MCLKRQPSKTILCQIALNQILALHRKYFRYLHQTNTIVLIILSTTVNRTKVHLSSDIVSRILFGCYLLFNCQQCAHLKNR